MIPENTAQGTEEQSHAHRRELSDRRNRRGPCRPPPIQHTEEAGRDPGTLGLEDRVRLAGTGPDDWIKAVQGWEAIGATHLSVSTGGRALQTPQQYWRQCGASNTRWGCEVVRSAVDSRCQPAALACSWDGLPRYEDDPDSRTAFRSCLVSVSLYAATVRIAAQGVDHNAEGG